MNSKRLWLAGLIVLVLMAARVWITHALGQTLFAQYPLVDAYTYWQQAEALWAGQNPFEEGLYQPPAYPYFIYGLSHFFNGPSLTVMRWVQAGLGLVTAVGIFGLGNYFGDRLQLYWVGCVAMLFYGLYPSVLLFEQDWLTPALSNALMVCGTLGLVHGRLWSVLLGAFLLGAAISVHPSLIFLAAAALYWVWRQGRKLWPVIVGVWLSLMPTVVWNIQNGTPALVSHNAGINLYIGNGSDWKETIFLRPGLEFRQWVMQADPAQRSVAERDRYWKGRTFDELRADPQNALLAVLTKAYWSIHNTEIPRNEDYRCRLDEPILQPLKSNPLCFAFLFPLGVLGGWLCQKNTAEDSALKNLPWFWVAAQLPLLLFFVSDRYRLATLPFLAILAAIGLTSLWKQLDRWRLMMVGIVALICMGPIDSRTEKSEAWCAHVQGNLAFMDEQWAQATERYRHSLRLNPQNLSAHLYLASLSERSGDMVAAEEGYRRVLDGYPDHNPTLMALAKLCEKQKNWDCVVEQLERAYRVPGNRVRTGIRLFKLLLNLKRERAAHNFVQGEDELWNHPEVMRWRQEKGL